jgi:hypothetical protein
VPGNAGEARRDCPAAAVDGARGFGAGEVADRGDAAAADADRAGEAVASAAVEDRSVVEDQVEGHAFL